jgi:hypothetical protein
MRLPYSQPNEIPLVEVRVGVDEFENSIRRFGARNAVEYFGQQNDIEFERDLINWLLERSDELN